MNNLYSIENSRVEETKRLPGRFTLAFTVCTRIYNALNYWTSSANCRIHFRCCCRRYRSLFLALSLSRSPSTCRALSLTNAEIQHARFSYSAYSVIHRYSVFIHGHFYLFAHFAAQNGLSVCPVCVCVCVFSVLVEVADDSFRCRSCSLAHNASYNKNNSFWFYSLTLSYRSVGTCFDFIDLNCE